LIAGQQVRLLCKTTHPQLLAKTGARSIGGFLGISLLECDLIKD
jgi:hypothetical protein